MITRRLFSEYIIEIMDIVNANFQSDSQVTRKTVKIPFDRFRPKVITIKEWNTVDSIKLDEIVGSLQLEMTPSVPKKKKH